MLSAERLLNLEWSVARVVREGVPGDLVECGTAKGGSAALLALSLRRLKAARKVYIFDTFEGLPPPTPEDPDYNKALPYEGQCRGELKDVQKLFEKLGVLNYAVFVKGRFQDTLPVTQLPPISLLHLDGDWYDSTMVCLEHLWDRVSPGGIVQIDDYGAWEGCRKAVDEFFQRRNSVQTLHTIDDTGRWLKKAAN
jgi:O-methyltransferase